jgi:hypothetical protein
MNATTFFKNRSGNTLSHSCHDEMTSATQRIIGRYDRGRPIAGVATGRPCGGALDFSNCINKKPPEDGSDLIRMIVDQAAINAGFDFRR